MHTPGHTPGSSCLLREATRTLLAGDTILKHITPNPVMNPDPRKPSRRFPALKNYLASLERVRALAPTLIHTSHGDVVTDFEEYLARLLRHTYERQSKVLGLVPKEGMTAHELADLLFPESERHHAIFGGVGGGGAFGLGGGRRQVADGNS